MTDPALLRAAVDAAVMAPSTHNTQPWRFRITGDTLDLFADRSRQLGAIDVARRQQIQSCGCALYNARVALRALGYTDEVTTMFVDRSLPDHVATLHVGAAREPTAADLELMRAIGLRHTNRRAFLPRPVPLPDSDALIAAAEAEGVACVRLDVEGKRTLAAIAREAQQRDTDDPAVLAERREWLTGFVSHRHDGVPAIEWQYGMVDELVLGAPVVLVFGTRQDDPAAWLATGEALEAVLLRAASRGLTGAFLNQLLEQPDLRDRVAALCPTIGVPQMIIRIGIPVEPILHAAPRRNLDDVLEIVPAH